MDILAGTPNRPSGIIAQHGPYGAARFSTPTSAMEERQPRPLGRQPPPRSHAHRSPVSPHLATHSQRQIGKSHLPVVPVPHPPALLILQAGTGTLGTPDHHQAAHAVRGLAAPHIIPKNSTACYPNITAPPGSTYADSAGCWLPEDSFANPHLLGYQHDNAYTPTAAVAAWNQQQSGVPVTYPQLQQQQTQLFDLAAQEALPPRSRHPSTPSIRVTTDFSQQFNHQQPQDLHPQPYSATSVSSASSVPLQEGYFPHPHNRISPIHLSPNTPFMAAPLDPRDMQTTTPPHSPHEEVALISEPMNRKRSHSQISTGPPRPPLPYSTGDSHHGSQAADEEFSPGRIAHRRGDPPMNEQRKFYCDYAEECFGQTFDRKCEWR